jgi:hypothetical protein
MKSHGMKSHGMKSHGMKSHGIVYRRPKHDLSDKQQPQEVDEKTKLLDFLKKTQYTLSFSIALP